MVRTSKINSLSDALRSGAEVGLSRAYANDPTGQRAMHFINTRLGALQPDEISIIDRLAKATLTAGEYINGLSPDDEIDPDSIPTNPEMLSTDQGNDRLKWWGEWNIPGTDEWYQFSGTLPAITDFPDIAVYAAELASSYIDEYPDKFHGPGGEVPSEVTVRIIGTDKAF